MNVTTVHNNPGSSSGSSVDENENSNNNNNNDANLGQRVETLEKQLEEAVAKREKDQEQIKACQNELNRLFRDCPDRPRETIAEIDKRMAKLERERETTSMPLQEEKYILITLHKLGKAKNSVADYEKCDKSIQEVKTRLTVLRAQLRALNEQITQQRIELSTVRVAQQLGCRVEDLLGRKVACPTSKLGQVIGRGGKNMQQLAGTANVTVNVDKNNNKSSDDTDTDAAAAVHLVGARSSLDKAALDLDRVISTTEEKIHVPAENLQYWTAKGIHVVDQVRSSHPDVYLDVSRKRTDSIVMRGIPADISSAKQDLLQSSAGSIVTHKWRVSNKEGSLVVGKQGSTIEALVESHQTVIDVQRDTNSTSDDEEDGTTIQVMGPSGHVQAAVREIQNLLAANREMEKMIEIDAAVKSTLLVGSGKGIQAMFQKVNDTLREENAGTVHVNLGSTASATDDSSTSDCIVVKGKARVLDQAVELVEAEVRRLEHVTVRIPVDAVVIPVLIGRGGRALKELRGERMVNVEFDRAAGAVLVCGLESSDVQAVVEDIRAVIASHAVERIALDPDQFKRQIRELLGTKSKEINSLVHMKVEDENFQIMLRGEEEKLAQAAAIVREFLAKSYIQEVEVSPEDFDVLLAGGKKSKIVELSKETGVTLNTNREKATVVAKGEKELVEKAVGTVRAFLFGGEGRTLCKLSVESDEMATVIGKGGKTKAGLLEKFPQVSITMHRHEDVISLRGPESDVDACRKEILSLLATSWTSHALDVTFDQAELLGKTKFHRRIMQTVPVKVLPKDSVVTIRGTKEDVRYATALLLERLGKSFDVGYYLESSFFNKVKESWRDPSHIQRMEKASGAKIKLEDKRSAILFSGKRAAVKKAKLEVLKFLNFAFSALFAKHDLPEPLMTSLGKSGAVAEIAADSGATVFLDRDVNAILIFASGSSQVDKAKEVLQAKIDDESKLVYVVQLEQSEDWIVSAILGKNGNTIKALRKKTNCKIDVVSADRRITVSAETEDLVAEGRSAIDEMIAKARREHSFVDVPSADMPAFVGKSGAHIKEFSAKHGVDVQILKKGKSQVRIMGNEEAVAAAETELEEWLAARSEKRAEEQATVTLTVKRDDIPRVIGTKGAVIRGLQREFGCKVDVDRQTGVVTFQGAKRALALQKIVEILRQDPEEEQEKEPATLDATEEKSAEEPNGKGGETVKADAAKVPAKEPKERSSGGMTTAKKAQSAPKASDFPSLSSSDECRRDGDEAQSGPSWASRLKEGGPESPAHTFVSSVVSDEDWEAGSEGAGEAVKGAVE